jgi:hypothetical protein
VAERSISGATADSVVDTAFAKGIVDANAASGDEGRRFVVAQLNTLSHNDLERLKKIIQDDMAANPVWNTDFPDNKAWEKSFQENEGKWIVGSTAIDRRLVHWVLNAIDDRLGCLRYDTVIDGYIGLIDSVSTVAYYDFKTISGKKIIVYIGTATLAESDGQVVYGHDWECHRGVVRLFVFRNTSLGTDYYGVQKITATTGSQPAVSAWPQCN